MGRFVKGLLGQGVRRRIFMAAFTIYMVELIVFTSMYAKVEPLQRFFAMVRVTSYLLVCCKLLLDFLAKTFSWKEIGVVGLLSLFLLWTAYKTGRKAILIYWAFIVAAHDIEFERIIKRSCMAHLWGLLFVFASRYAGIIENRIYAPTSRQRDSMGFQFATEGPNFFFYTILMWIYWRKENITWLELAALSAGNFFLFYKTDTKSAFALGCVALVLAALLKVSRYLRRYHRFYVLPAVGSVPFLAYGIFKLSVHFNQGKQWMADLNKLLSSRLALGKAGYMDYGVELWGRRIEWVGGTNGFEDIAKAYNYVDSSFLQILLQYGLVFLLFLIIVFMILGIKTAIKKDTYFLLVFLMFAVHSTFDPQIIWMEFNSFVMLYSYFYWKGEKSFYLERLVGDIQRNRRVVGICVLLFALLFGQIGSRKLEELQVRTDQQQRKEMIYKWALEESNKQIEDIKESMMLTGQQVQKQQHYIDGSAYMKLDGEKIYVADVQYELRAENNADNILNSLAFYINEGGLQGDIAKQYGSELTKYWREVASCTIQDDILYISVMHHEEEGARDSLSIIRANLEKQIPVIARVQGEFSLVEMNSSLDMKEDSGIANTQQGNRDNLENYKKNYSDLKERAANVEESWENYEKMNFPENPGIMAPGRIVVVQYVVIGMVFGVSVMCIWFILLYVVEGMRRLVSDK